MNLDRARSITGWMSDPELSFLAEIASKSNIIFEIGSYHGRSTKALADNSPSDTKIYAIDSWNGTLSNGYSTSEQDLNIFYLNMHDYINSGKVIISFKNWEDFNPPVKADFIFIDGDHSYEAVKRDIKKAIQYLNQHGVLAGHDYNWPSVQKAVREELDLRYIHNKETIWWLRKS